MSTVVSGAIIIALFGWFATIIAISRSKLSSQRKRMLLVPSWIPWLVLALGAPILSGLISWQDALNLGGAITTGMLVSVVISRSGPRR
ncbi:hypothetical protein SE17_27545 [Kouleothrix aurantiaca]|jgi:hypothetical protein|uniref:Uncharacterized protein n=1 Tax=Kouleothrix aurantiaca TaxID=186479 RepID=A0A0P9DKG2_9CHLR|nr:hypothetical protein SE17_27545 [Kouleothrix aurantiaca]